MVTGEPEGVRASDGEREAVVERLSRALSQGRVDLVEFEERVRAVYAAVTREQLDELTRDLPGRLW